MNCKLTGWFDIYCRAYRGGPLLWEDHFPNGATTAGLNDLLGVAFNSTTQKTAWYLGWVDNAAFSAFAAGDTMSSHSGWTESTDYTEGTRVQWTPLSVAAGSIVNTSVAAFTANSGAATVKGIFLCSVSTKGGSTGILWATGAFSTTRTPSAAQVLQVTYRVTGTG